MRRALWLAVLLMLILPLAARADGCVGACYGSAANCERNCGQPCVKVDAHEHCGWPEGYRAYRCCREASPTASPAPSATATHAATATATRTPRPTATLGSAGGQPGIAYQAGGFDGYPALHIGWWYNYYPVEHPVSPAGAQYVQVIRLRVYTPPEALVRAAARANPASVWIIGNEPDERSQDYMTPDAYAQEWRKWGRIIKDADPYALLAFGPIAYMDRTWWLDQAIAAHVKRYGKPPEPAILAPHGYGCKTDAACFASRIAAFRQWMARQGWQDRPLWVAEYGVLGWTTEASAKAFMRSTWDAMRTMRDETTGYRPDNYRLVQRWAWFSGNCPQNIVEHAALYNGAALSVYGRAWAEYWGQ